MMEADFVHFALEDICHRLPTESRKDGVQVPNSEVESSEVGWSGVKGLEQIYNVHTCS